MSDQTTPTFASVFAAMLDANAAQTFTAIPGRVVGYDATERSAVVQPVGMRAHRDESGARVLERYPVIAGVAVLFQGGNGGGITFPLIPGDGVLIVFMQSSIDQWLARDGDPDPRDDRRHAYSDAVAIPGLMSFKNAAPADDTNIEITAPVGGEIHVGGSDQLATKADIDALRSWALTHGHPTTATVGTGPVAPPSGSPTSAPPTPFGTLVLKGS